LVKVQQWVGLWNHECELMDGIKI